MLHTSAGYLLQTMWTTRLVFDLHDDDVYWCTADIGWVTGHSYIVYGPLANGASIVMYEGAPDQPRRDRFWEIIERYKVTIFYTSPTAIRAFMSWGNEWLAAHDLSSLRLLGSVGEPINPAAWRWYFEAIGRNRCPIVDTWWQTETGAIMISPLPGATPAKPGSATLPLPGIIARVVNLKGQPVKPGETGYLTIQKPWPSMLRTIYGDDERYAREYWSRIPGVYFAGDAAQCDKDGYIWVLGRVDDVIKVAGHRLSSMEIESVLVSHPSVAEAAVVARPDEIKGEAIICFVTLRGGKSTGRLSLRAALMDHVATTIGTIARPAEVRFGDMLPKTRSGKIMRRLLREVAAQRRHHRRHHHPRRFIRNRAPSQSQRPRRGVTATCPLLRRPEPVRAVCGRCARFLRPGWYCAKGSAFAVAHVAAASPSRRALLSETGYQSVSWRVFDFSRILFPYRNESLLA